MGYRGKVEEQARARELRAEGKVLADIAAELGVSKSSVSLWVRDVEFTPSKRRYGPRRQTNRLAKQRLAEIAQLDDDGRRRIGRLDDLAFLAAGAALYAGEGSKGDGKVLLANTDPAIVRFFCSWLRYFFEIDESRLRAKVYLHQGLDLEGAEKFWADLTGIPRDQFRAPYRAVADPSIRHEKHQMGCVSVYYCSSRCHRSIMGLIRALLSSDAIPG